jgi:hypothetical protein
MWRRNSRVNDEDVCRRRFRSGNARRRRRSALAVVSVMKGGRWCTQSSGRGSVSLNSRDSVRRILSPIPFKPAIPLCFPPDFADLSFVILRRPLPPGFSPCFGMSLLAHSQCTAHDVRLYRIYALPPCPSPPHQTSHRRLLPRSTTTNLRLPTLPGRSACEQTRSLQQLQRQRLLRRRRSARVLPFRTSLELKKVV